MASQELPNVKELKTHVRTGLTNLRHGDLFMTHGLKEDEALLDSSGDFPDRSEKKHPFNMFLSAVAEGIVEALGYSKGKKKKKRAIEDLLHDNKSKWGKMIEKIHSSPTARKVAPSVTREDGKEDMSVAVDVAVDVEVETPLQDVNTKEEKPSKKRKAEAKPSSVNKVLERLDDDDGLSDLNDDSGEDSDLDEDSPIVDRTDKAYLKRKAEFERKKEEVLATIPKETKKKFGQICFARWNKGYLPALVLSPFHVPVHVRDTWYQMFEKVQANNRIQNMTNMLYWYGSSDVPQFSLMATKSILSFEEGEKKGYGKLTPAMVKKIEKGEELSAKQLEIKRSIDEMNADLKKAPEDRFGYLGGYLESFPEEYDTLDSEEEQVTVDEEVEPPKPKKQKKSNKKSNDAEEDLEDSLSSKPKTKGKKKKKTEVSVGPEDGNSETSTEVKQPKKKAKTKKNTPKVEEPESESDGKSKGKSKKSKKAKPDVGAETDVVGHGDTIDDIGDDEIPSDDDKDDEEIEPPSESDDDDVDFELPSKPKPNSKKEKTKKAPAKKAVVAKAKIKPPKELSLGQRKKKEQADFEECEDKFFGLIESWEAALGNCEDKAPNAEEKKKLEMILGELLKQVEKFTAPFIEAYNFSQLIRTTKKVYDCEKRKELWTKMKVIYNTKKAALPKNFKLKETAKMARRKTSTSEAKEETTKAGTQVGDEAIAASSIKSEPNVEAEGTGPSPNQAIAPADWSIPIKRTGSLEALPAPEASISTDQALPPPESPAKAERKRFSLGNLLKPTEKEAKSKVRRSVDRPSASSQHSRQPKFPTWISEPTLSKTPPDENREFALEHLQQAAPFIPLSLGKEYPVNHNAIARSLEHAIHDWSCQKNPIKNSSWEDTYWNKVHDIVASICGNKEPGTLAALIGEGRIQTPDILLKLSDDDLMASFEGRPLSL